ncbi:hypothetical protein QJS10_CPB12g00407 [Acorus calamus]|uniref:Uncharacterized protein n=1 Tax=Acorus calamus TaxID=4465 RepID=A0AAV9DLE0_ACOCL|nr:hypothetical protein QJS10_CPB12g00407 [Acorus calamus]
MDENVVIDNDERREGALAANPALGPDFQSSRVSKSQLDKFKELHNRRLQIKARLKRQRNSKGNAKVCNTALKFANEKDETLTTAPGDANISASEPNNCLMYSNQAGSSATKKRQKLHWGLDTRERWERKANM